MRILIFGAGGVGGYIAANLCGFGDEITVVARGKHLEAIRSHGLHIVEDGRTYDAVPDIVADDSALEGIYDIVVLGVKSYDMDRAIAALSLHTDERTVILPAANGVDHFDKIEARLHGRLMRGCCYILAHVESPGTIRKKGKVFAAVFGSKSDPDAVETAAGIFERAGLRCKTPDDIDEAVWKKYLFISAFATLTSFHDTGIKAVCEARPEETETVLKEIAAVARANGIEIGGEVKKAMETALSLPVSASTSMHLDFQQKKPTELESLSGYVVKEAKRLGIDVPTMEKLYSELKRKEGE